MHQSVRMCFELVLRASYAVTSPQWRESTFDRSVIELRRRNGSPCFWNPSSQNSTGRTRLGTSLGTQLNEAQAGEATVLKVIIVEDDPRLAASLRHALEQNIDYRVTAVTDDLASTMVAVEGERPDLALIDLQLANSSSGFNVAAKLHDLQVSCLFMTGSVPSFPLPDLAIGCLAKPFTESDLLCSLEEAEDILRRRQRIVLRRKLPERLQLYDRVTPAAPGDGWTLAPGWPNSWRRRVRRFIRRASHFRSAVRP